jgi:RNA polymerase sigma factor (sigma-70 family)
VSRRIANPVLRDVRALFDAGTAAGLTDAQLLERYVSGREAADAAFEAIVARHGPMVWGVCRCALPDPNDAADAFQATFLVLLRKARSVRVDDSLGRWLYGVSRRVAARARATALRRSDREVRSVEALSAPPHDPDGDEILHELYREIDHLPERYRAAVQLCDVEGLSIDAAAQRLGCPSGTVGSRLSRGRQRVRERLTRRGLAPTALIPCARLRPQVPAGLLETTTRAATGVLATSAAALTHSVLRSMLVTRIAILAAALVTLGLVGLGAAALAGPRRDVGPSAAVVQVTDKPAPAAPDQAEPPKVYSHPITVSGRAFDNAGRPIANARIYLASRWGDYKRVAETITDREGCYVFRDAPLPIQRADTHIDRDRGVFQVFGQARGFGLAWRPSKSFCPKPRPGNITEEPDWRDAPSRYEAKDTIALDLHFPPPARLSGVVTDDRGKPLAGVRLEIRECESLKNVDNIIPGWTLDSLNEPDTVPPEIKLRTSDARGRFDFTELPENCRFRIEVRAQGFPRQWIQAATTPGPQPDHDGSPVLTGDLTIELATPLNVPVKVVYGDTGRPAPNVAVEAAQGAVSVLETSDAQGRVTLRMLPGTYRMQNWPARGTPYLVTDGKLVVGPKPPEELVVAALDPASILEVTVVDAETGEGVPGLDLWRQDTPGGRRTRIVMRSWEVATRTAWRESPRTDPRGKTRAYLEPGTRRVGVGLDASPTGLEVVESKGQEVECLPGETVRLEFTIRRRL